MKKLIFAVVFAVIMAAGSPVFAQTGGRHQSEYYYVNVSLEKVYPYRTGYIVQYRKGINDMDRAYIPMSWFTGAATKGELITLPKGKAWPSLSVYYKNGEFSHVRLYVHAQASHPTWGTVPQSVNLDDHFGSIQEVHLKFQ